MACIDRRSFLYVAGTAIVSHVSGLRAASSGPALVMLMRHGEDIGEESFHLSPEGVKRAQALPRLFPSRLPTPQVIIATHSSKNSNRPVETVEPLARQLHLEIDNRFRQDDFEELARALLTDERFDGKVVLVCWHHGSLPKLARALGVKNAPKWPATQSDRVWVIDFKKHGRAQLDEVHQQLLGGDR